MKRCLKTRVVSATCLQSVLLALVLSGCGEDIQRVERGMGGGARAKGAAKGKKGAAEAEGQEAEQSLQPMTYKDDDFVESEKNRDPFRSYIGAFRTRAPEVMQRRVIMPTTAVEEMKLVAIIGGIPQPKAMLVDPLGVGHVVERGDYVGRPKVVQATGSVSMTLNWRVDRIRDGEIVLTQLDPTDPTRPALTRVMPLHETVATR